MGMRKIIANFLLAISMLIILIGCSSFSSISDEELVRIAESYYRYNYSEKSIEMAVFERSKYEKECDCYPVRFIITRPSQDSTKMTFYFFKNDSGKFEARKFEKGIKFLSN
jgi:hypothetical protein